MLFCYRRGSQNEPERAIGGRQLIDLGKNVWSMIGLKCSRDSEEGDSPSPHRTTNNNPTTTKFRIWFEKLKQTCFHLVCASLEWRLLLVKALLLLLLLPSSLFASSPPPQVRCFQSIHPFHQLWWLFILMRSSSIFLSFPPFFFFSKSTLKRGSTRQRGKREGFISINSPFR